MRVTRSMMVNNMSYWVSQQAEKLSDAQTEVGSGKKINKPSDDPIGAGQILSDSVRISQYGQYESNITQAQTWVKASSATLDAVSSTLQDASNAVATYLSGGTSATASVGTLTDYYNEILSLANSSYASSYMYSGNLSSTEPFANGVTLAGVVPVNIQFGLGGAATSLNIAISDSTGAVVRNINVPAGGTLGTNTVTWNGRDNSNILLANGEYTFTVTATNGTNAVAAYPTYHGDTGEKEVLTGVNENVTLNNDGGSIFSSILSNISQAITAVTSNSTTALSTTGTALQANSSTLEAQQVKLSNAAVQLDSSNTRLQQLTINASNRISDLETGSTEKAAIELQAQQTAYEEVIAATGNVIKMPKLTDYL